MIIKHIKTFNKELLLEVLEIDKTLYDKKYQGTYSSVSKRYKAFNEMFIVAINDGKLIGYLCFFPINNSLFNKIINSNTLFDDNIKQSDITDLKLDSINHLFLISIAVLAEYQGLGVASKLMAKLDEYIVEKRALGYKIDSVLLSSINDKGKRLFSSFGYKKIKKYLPDLSLLKKTYLNNL